MTTQEKKRTTYAQKLGALVRQKKYALEVLRELVNLKKGQLSEIRAAVAERSPDLELENQQILRVLDFARNWGLVFQDPESKCYHPTTLSLQIIWDERSVDWLNKACLAHSIIAESEPETDVVSMLAGELGLEPAKAEAVRNALESVPRPLRLPRFGRCLRRGGEKVEFVPTEYPKLLKDFNGILRNYSEKETAKANAAERMFAPRMDVIAERMLLNALRHAGYDDEANQLITLPMGQRFLQVCKGKGTPTSPLVFQPHGSVVSMSSPKVNPFALDLMLRYESPVSFAHNYDEMNLELDPDRGAIAPFAPTPETDYGVVLRFVDPETQISHFVIFGMYPPGTLAAARYFRSQIDDLLKQFREEPFVVVIETNRLSVEEWGDDGKHVVAKALHIETFKVAPRSDPIDIRYQPGLEALMSLGETHKDYFIRLLGQDDAMALTGYENRLAKAHRLMSILQRKDILLETIIDALLIESFVRRTPIERRELVKAARKHDWCLGKVANQDKFRTAFEHNVLDYTWDAIDAHKSYVKERLDAYDFYYNAELSELVKRYSQSPVKLTKPVAEATETRSAKQ
jgi:hypothetical protein